MGGKIFATGPKALRTPRMVPEIYACALRRTTNALRPLFPTIKSPIEAPEKTSFGDVDMFLSLEGAAFTQVEINDPKKIAVWAAIEKELGAFRSFQELNAFHAKSFAVPWPVEGDAEVRARQRALVQEADCEAESVDKASSKAVGSDSEAESEPCFVQIDVDLRSSNKDIEWRVFKHDHGDLWSILGTVIHQYGLTVSEQGLYIRIPELERSRKKMARVFLTDCPGKVLDFLVHDGVREEWNKPFPSVVAMYDYAARCKWYRAWIAHEKQLSMASVAFSERLKSSDRQRLRSRSIYARWIEEHVPQQMQAVSLHVKPPTREELRDHTRALAFKVFPGAKERYAQQLLEWEREKMRIYVKNTLIKTDVALPSSVASVLPPPREGSSLDELEQSWRSTLRFALTKIIVNEWKDFVDRDGDVIVPPPGLRDERGVFVEEEVKAWINENWERVGRAAWAAQCTNYAEYMRIKEKLEQERLEQEGLTENQAVLRPPTSDGACASEQESVLGGP